MWLKSCPTHLVTCINAMRMHVTARNSRYFKLEIYPHEKKKRVKPSLKFTLSNAQKRIKFMKLLTSLLVDSGEVDYDEVTSLVLPIPLTFRRTASRVFIRVLLGQAIHFLIAFPAVYRRLRCSFPSLILSHGFFFHMYSSCCLLCAYNKSLTRLAYISTLASEIVVVDSMSLHIFNAYRENNIIMHAAAILPLNEVCKSK